MRAGFSGMGAAFQSAHTQIRAAVAAPIAQHFVALGDSTVVAAAKANTMTQAYRPLTASLAAASVAAASFKTAASGVIGALGGPWGVALMAAGAAVAYFARSRRRRRRRGRRNWQRLWTRTRRLSVRHVRPGGEHAQRRGEPS